MTANARLMASRRLSSAGLAGGSLVVVVVLVARS